MCCEFLNVSKLNAQRYWPSQGRKSWCVSFYKHRAKRVPWVFGFLLGQREQRTIENSALSVGQICLSLSPSQLSKAPSETLSLSRSASGLGVRSQILLIKQACADAAVGEGQILYSTYRKRGAYPRMHYSLQLRSWGRCRQHQSGSSPRYGAWCWKHELAVWLRMEPLNPVRCQDVGFLWGQAVQ